MTLGFFAPLPLALMIPFMATQSLAMGEAFGLGFQYGKRRISAMSNEDFNKITPEALHKTMQAGVKEMIPDMKQSISNFTLLQTDIIKELVHYASNIINESPELVRQFLGLGGSSGTNVLDTGGNILFDVLKALVQQGTGVNLNVPTAEATNLPPPESDTDRLHTSGAYAGYRESQLDIRDTSGQTIRQFLDNKEKIRRDQIRQQTQVKPNEASLQQIISKAGVVTSKRKAGQSQKNERKRLIAQIASQAAPGYKFTLSKYGAFDSRTKAALKHMQQLQARLTILLQRYIF